jgi:hypothetical protein
MQPTTSGPLLLVFYINAIMTGKATAKEQELQGASGGHSNYLLLVQDGEDDGAAVEGNTT